MPLDQRVRFASFTTWKTCGMCGGSQDFLQRGLAGCGLEPTCRFAPWSSLVFEQQSHKQETCIKSLSSLAQYSALSVDQRSGRALWWQRAASESVSRWEKWTKKNMWHESNMLIINIVDQVCHPCLKRCDRSCFLGAVRAKHWHDSDIRVSHNGDNLLQQFRV